VIEVPTTSDEPAKPVQLTAVTLMKAKLCGRTTVRASTSSPAALTSLITRQRALILFSRILGRNAWGQARKAGHRSHGNWRYRTQPRRPPNRLPWFVTQPVVPTRSRISGSWTSLRMRRPAISLRATTRHGQFRLRRQCSPARRATAPPCTGRRTALALRHSGEAGPHAAGACGCANGGGHRNYSW